MAIVGNVRVGQEQVVAADNRLTAAALGATVQGNEFTHHVAIPQPQERLLTMEFEILRLGSDRRKLENSVVLADLRPVV